MADKAILYDATKCTACRGCQVACKEWNDLPGELTTNRGTYENPPDLSANTWIKIRFTEVETTGDIRWLFTRRACMHCTDAACVEVCPTKALYHHEMGFVAYRRDLCSGCGYCVEACPFAVPKSGGNNLTGIRVANKCLFCEDRITNGEIPACVKTCPTGALVFGDRDDLVAEGRARVQSLKAEYPNAYLYGDTELGGLHVLYVLDDLPEVYGLPTNPKVPVAATAWQDVLQPIGWGLAGIAVVGLGLNYLIARRKVKVGSEEH
ncbi:MAG: 4Fe-4S dicluster domain-containing protein [Chloroflexota bacterium]|nr:4Fe-4S dicluster domain-containing protein [Chloroflexota bacterium]